jgi:hypothetical protein
VRRLLLLVCAVLLVLFAVGAYAASLNVDVEDLTVMACREGTTTTRSTPGGGPPGGGPPGQSTTTTTTAPPGCQTFVVCGGPGDTNPPQDRDKVCDGNQGGGDNR